MPKPWEEFAQQPTKPWEEYATPQPEQPIEQPVQEPEGLMGDLGERGAEIGKIVSGGYPDQSPLSDVAQVGGQVAGGAFDVIGAGIGALIPDTAKELAGDAAGGLMGYLSSLYTPEQLEEIKGVYGDLETYTREVAEQHPELARNLGAGVNIAGALPMVKPLAGGLSAVKSSLKRKEPVTMDSLWSAEKEAYNAVKEQAVKSGTTIKTGGMKKNMMFEVEKAFSPLNLGKVNPDLHKKTVLSLNAVKEAMKGSIDPLELEDLRKTLNGFAEDATNFGIQNADSKHVRAIVDALDNAVDNVKPKDIVKGNAEFNQLFKDARHVSKVRRKATPIEKIFRDAAKEDPAFRDKYIKNRFKALARSDRKMKPYTREERFLIDKAGTTGAFEGILNKIGIFSPTGGALGMGSFGLSGAAAGAGNPALMALPIAGMVSKGIAGKVAARNAAKAQKSVMEQLNPQKSLTDRAKDLYGKNGALKKLQNQKGAIEFGDKKPLKIEGGRQLNDLLKSGDAQGLKGVAFHASDTPIKKFDPEMTYDGSFYTSVDPEDFFREGSAAKAASGNKYVTVVEFDVPKMADYDMQDNLMKDQMRGDGIGGELSESTLSILEPDHIKKYTSMTFDDFEKKYRGKGVNISATTKPKPKPLPMDKSSRMQRAKEQGFDVDNPVYHGTSNKAIEQIEKGGFKASDGLLGKGVYLTSNKDRATTYATGRMALDKSGGEVLETYVKGKIAQTDDYEKTFNYYYEEKGLPRRRAFMKVQKHLEDRGFSGIKVGGNTMVFDPKNIRSTHAKFDPKSKKSKNLLAGGAGAATAATLATQKGEAK